MMKDWIAVDNIENLIDVWQSLIFCTTTLCIDVCPSYFLHHWSLCNRTRCVDVLLLMTRPSNRTNGHILTTTLTCGITRHTTGDILPYMATKFVSFSLSCCLREVHNACRKVVSIFLLLSCKRIVCQLFLWNLVVLCCFWFLLLEVV